MELKTRELKPLIDFVEEKEKNQKTIEYVDKMDWLDNMTEDALDIYLYAKFLRTPLTLSMFIPCDEEGNPMEEPHFNIGKKRTKIYLEGSNHVKAWKKAKEAVLFEVEDIEILPRGVFFNFKDKQYAWKLCWNKWGLKMDIHTFSSIEKLTWLGPILTPTAIKKIGLQEKEI